MHISLTRKIKNILIAYCDNAWLFYTTLVVLVHSALDQNMLGSQKHRSGWAVRDVYGRNLARTQAPIAMIGVRGGCEIACSNPLEKGPGHLEMTFGNIPY